MNGSNRNLIIIIAGIIGVCICGACVVAGVTVALPIITAANQGAGALATVQAELTLQPIGTPFRLPTIGGLPTIPSIPTIALTPPINIQRGTPTPPSLS